MTLPVVRNDHTIAIADANTGEVVPLRDAPDDVIAAAAAEVARLDKELLDAKRALAAEMRQRHGVGKVRSGDWQFTVAESRTWPEGRTRDALERLVEDGKIAEADAKRAMPLKPKPDSRALKSLLERLMMSDPEAAKVLADACTFSPPSLRDIEALFVDGEAA